MRRLASSLIALVVAVPALAEEVTTLAPVAAATVYPSGAELTLRASVELPAGAHRVVLPYGGIDELSALPRIRTSEGVAIGALGFQRDVRLDREALFTPAQAAAFAEVERLEDAVAAQSDTIAEARASAKALAARRDFLAAVEPGEEATAEDILAMADMLRGEMAATEAELVTVLAGLRPLDEAMEDLKDALTAAKDAFERLSPPDEVSDLLSVEVILAEAGPVVLELTELTPYAGWEVDYDLDLDREDGQLAVARKLIVTQNTGQIWDGVALTLSTARPGEEVGPSEVEPDQAWIREPMELMRGMAGAPMMEEAEMFADAAPAPMLLEPAMKTAELEIDGLALSYAYPDPVTIASAEAAELALDELGFAADPATHASPRWDETAFSVATFTNDAPEPILPGWANILRDGHLVGREWIEMIPAGAEVTLPFGPIEGLRLDTVFERNEEGDTGILARSNTREQLITFTIENLTGERQDVRALFPLTYSEQEDLRVEVTANPAPDETDLDKKRGVSAWDLEIAPGETAEVKIMVELNWPEGQELIWSP